MGYIETANYAAWHIPCYANHNCPKRPPRFISSDTTTEKPIKNVYAGINALVRNIQLDFSSSNFQTCVVYFHQISSAWAPESWWKLFLSGIFCTFLFISDQKRGKKWLKKHVFSLK